MKDKARKILNNLTLAYGAKNVNKKGGGIFDVAKRTD